MSEVRDFRPPQHFIKDLGELRIRESRTKTTNDDFIVHTLDLSPLKLRVGRFMQFLIPAKFPGPAAPTEAQLSKLIAKFVDFSSNVEDFAILLLGWRFDLDAVRDSKDFPRAAILALDGMDAVRNARDLDSKYVALGIQLTRFLGTRVLSPYLRRKPAVAGRFFGRRTSTKEILDSRENFTIVGNRRIGKTSLLSEIRDRLRAMYRPDSIRIGWLVGGLFNSTETVVRKLLDEVGAHKEAREIDTDPYRVRDLPGTLKAFAAREKVSIFVFIDEIDRVLEFDALQNNQLLWILKAAFEVPEHRLFLAGFRRAIQAYYDIDHPLNNIGPIQLLRCLSKDETLEMIRIPLQRMGIVIEGEYLQDAIYRETGGHPELIQMVCKALIQIYENSGKVPSVDELLEHLLYQDEFEQNAHQTFLANTNVFERALCYLLIRDAMALSAAFEEYEFDATKAKALLANAKIDIPGGDVANLLRNLEVSSIFRKIRGTAKYVFAVPQLARFCENNGIDEQLANAIEEARTSPDSVMVEWPADEKLTIRPRSNSAVT